MSLAQTPEYLEVRQRKIDKIQHYLNQGMSYRKIGKKFNPPMTAQAVLYYIVRYEITKKLVDIKEFKEFE